MDDLDARLATARSLVDAIGHVLPQEESAAFTGALEGITRRLGYAGEEVLVALVGGTGSGKSSLLNALAGEPVASAGVLRPTTAKPLAWIPASPDPGLTRLLNDFGILSRVGHYEAPWLAVIDLPDVDSIEVEHRRIVEGLLPKVDVIAWVVDPEKYADRVLHDDFIQPLRRYQDQFVFILNQVDRIPDIGRGEVVNHLRGLLADGGIDATILSVAAHPPDGIPRGIDALREHLEARFADKDTVRSKLMVDLDRLVLQIGERVGGGTPIPSWDGVREPIAKAAHTLLAPPHLDDGFARAGQLTAARRTSGPLGFLLGLLRRGGRIVGAAQPSTALEETTSRWREREGRAALEALATATFMDAATGAGPILGADLREGAAVVPADIEAAMEVARRDVSAELAVPPRRWWHLLGVLNWIGGLAVAAGVGWAWFDASAIRPGEGFDPVLLGGAGLLLSLLIGWVGRLAGRRAGRTSAREFRVSLDSALGRSIDRRLGESYREKAESARVLQQGLADFTMGSRNQPFP